MVVFGYYYYGKKDYEDMPQKAWYMAKVGFATGTSITAYYLMARPMFPQTAEFVGGKWIRYTVPFTSSLVLGSMCTSTIARLRGNKDDWYNHFFGFMPTSIIWTALLKSSGKGAAAAFFMSVFAVLGKMHDDYNILFEQDLPNGRHMYSGSFGGINAGDNRWIWPSKFIVPDPGRYPPL
jgi:hypothetical protein